MIVPFANYLTFGNVFLFMNYLKNCQTFVCGVKFQFYYPVTYVSPFDLLIQNIIMSKKIFL